MIWGCVGMFDSIVLTKCLERLCLGPLSLTTSLGRPKLEKKFLVLKLS